MAKNSFTDWDTTANNNTDVAGVNIAEGCAPSGINNAIRAMMAQLKAGVDGKASYAAKASGYTAVASDNGAYHRATAGITVSLTAAATLGSGWHLFIQANGGAVVIDPNGAETVNGAATVTISDGQSALLACSGSAFFASIIPGLASINTWSSRQNFTQGGEVQRLNSAAASVGPVFIQFRDNANNPLGFVGIGGANDQLSVSRDTVGQLNINATSSGTLRFTGNPAFDTAVPVASGGTGAATAATARTNLGFAGAIAAWVNFNGTGTPAIRASGNVSSITDNGVGDYTVNFTSSLTDANYAVCGFSGTTTAAPTNITNAGIGLRGGGDGAATTKTASACRIVTGNSSTGTATDIVDISVSFLR